MWRQSASVLMMCVCVCMGRGAPKRWGRGCFSCKSLRASCCVSRLQLGRRSWPKSLPSHAWCLLSGRSAAAAEQTTPRQAPSLHGQVSAELLAPACRRPMTSQAHTQELAQSPHTARRIAERSSARPPHISRISRSARPPQPPLSLFVYRQHLPTAEL